jgi:hypothetical protein
MMLLLLVILAEGFVIRVKDLSLLDAAFISGEQWLSDKPLEIARYVILMML